MCHLFLVSQHKETEALHAWFICSVVHVENIFSFIYLTGVGYPLNKN